MTTMPDETSAPNKTRFRERLPSIAPVILKRKVTWASLACIATLGLVIWEYKAISAETMLVVSCEGIKGGYICKIAPSGARVLNAKVCWEIHDVCENGVKSMAAKCIRDTLEPGREIRALIASSEFSNYGSCDKLSRREIESLFMEKVREAQVPAQK